MVLRHALLGFLLVAAVFSAPSTKVEPKLAASLKGRNLVNIFVKFQGGNTPALRRTQLLRFGSRTEKIIHLVSDLKALSESSQQNALSLLRARSPYSAVSYKQFWGTNELYVKGANAQLVYQLATLPEVAEIREERVISLEPLKKHDITPFAEWNIKKIEADEAWQLPGGNNGQGVVVANIDTGVRRTHEALKNNHRERYGWFDPYDNTETANDQTGHGTHTMGVIAGSGGIGVAPGAQWIACKGCNIVTCSESSLKACGQWIVCPTLPNGESPDCSQTPNVVSNSWGGGQGDDNYNDIIELWKAANIIPVFAIGNRGPSCGTASSPGDQDVIAVGSITPDDSIVPVSSAGPSIDGKLKPDISAPGIEIRSSWYESDNSYMVVSVASVACPHVSGTAALLLSQNPELTYAEVKALLENNTDRNLVDTGLICNGIPSTEFPNNQYGYGRVNARKALQAAINGD